MIGFGKKLALAGGLLGLYGAYALAQESLAAGPFTADQVTQGRSAYMASCAACHQANLSGQGDALPLAGRQFLSGWSGRTTHDLYNLIHASMPATAPGSL